MGSFAAVVCLGMLIVSGQKLSTYAHKNVT